MKQRLFFLLLLSIIFLTGCFGDSLYIDVKFENNTDCTLVFHREIRELSDTLLQEDSPWPDGIKDSHFVINPHSTHVSRFMRSGFNHLAEHGKYHSFYFFDIDTIKSVAWERVRAENIYVKKVDFYSINDLEYKYDCVICIP